MDSTITASLIGVGASIIVFIATIIANYSFKKHNLKFEIESKHSEELCSITKKFLNNLSDIRYKNNSSMNSLVSYSKKDNLNKIDLDEIKSIYILILNNIVILMNDLKDTKDFIDNHSITLFEFNNYSKKISKLSEDLYIINDELFQYHNNCIRDNNYKKGVKTLEVIKSKYNLMYDEFYFYFYNLNVSLQNKMYSKIFKNKKVELLKNDNYELL